MKMKFFHILEKDTVRKINSIDELISKREESEPLPEDVAAYLKYKKETGRGFEDYAKLQKDLF